MSRVAPASCIVSGEPSGALLADPAMAFLRDALDPAYMADALTPLLCTWAGERLAVVVHGASVLRHKIGRRCLIEYDVWIRRRGSTAQALPMLGKVGARSLDERSYTTQTLLRAHGFDAASPDGISVPEPLGMLPALHMWLQRRVNGEPAWPAAESQRELGRRVAAAAHKLHCAPLRPSRAHGVEDELAILHERLGALARQRPLLAARIDRVLHGCQRVAAALSERPVRPIHRDFYADQLLLDGDRTHVLDLDLFCAGDPALDYGNFIGHLVERSLRLTGRADAYQDAQAELENRFDQSWGAGGCRAVRAYTTLTLARHIDISARIEARQPFTGLLLEECEARL